MITHEQLLISAKNDFKELTTVLKEKSVRRLLLVCGRSIEKLRIYPFLQELQSDNIIELVRFSDFHPNPEYDSVVKGVDLFRAKHCDAIMAVGGGSAIDVAKCIKLFADMTDNVLYLQQEIIPNEIPLIVMPTTAGTGSEATRFAVIYYQGEKQSVTHESCIPDMVIFDGSVLAGLPVYHKKAAMLDAFCHAVESMWSVHATSESKEYAKQAMRKILQFKESYLANDAEAAWQMLMAANLAGKAINITQTTAGHAMSYKLTAFYGIAHGHAVSVCVESVWQHMLAYNREDKMIRDVLAEIADIMGYEEPAEACRKFSEMLNEMDLYLLPASMTEDIEMLSESVNPVRLKNHPIVFGEQDIRMIYQKIYERRAEKQ